MLLIFYYSYHFKILVLYSVDNPIYTLCHLYMT